MMAYFINRKKDNDNHQLYGILIYTGDGFIISLTLVTYNSSYPYDTVIVQVPREIRGPNCLTRAWCMNHLIAANKNPDMRNMVLTKVYKIAWHCF